MEKSDFFGHGTIEKSVPENGEGADTGIVSLAGRWAKLEGVCAKLPTPLFALQNWSRCSWVKNSQ